MKGITFGKQKRRSGASATAEATRRVVTWLTDGTTIPAAATLIVDLGGKEVAAITAAEVGGAVGGWVPAALLKKDCGLRRRAAVSACSKG